MHSFSTSISPAQRRIAEVLARFYREERPALVPDLLRELGLAAESSLTPTLKVMQREGWVEIDGGGARGRSRVVRLTARGRFVTGMRGLPLVGQIAAGYLTEALSEPEQFVEDRDLLSYQPGDFLLRVKGTSMIGDGILDGDKVLLRPQVAWHNGEIAAVQVGDEHEATLKRVFQKGATIQLKASNPQFPDVKVKASEVTICGVFRGLIRDQHR